MKLTSLLALLVIIVALSPSQAAFSSATKSLKSHSKTWMKDARTSGVVRERRAVSPLTASEIKEAVGRHNALRAAEGADNMERMVTIIFVYLIDDKLHAQHQHPPRSEGHKRNYIQ